METSACPVFTKNEKSKKFSTVWGGGGDTRRKGGEEEEGGYVSFSFSNDDGFVFSVMKT